MCTYKFNDGMMNLHVNSKNKTDGAHDRLSKSVLEIYFIFYFDFIRLKYTIYSYLSINITDTGSLYDRKHL